MAEEKDARGHSDPLEAVQQIVGHRFKDLDLLKSSLTHGANCDG